MARSRAGRDMLVCLAQVQTAGRGRQQRLWQHARGQVALSWRGLASVAPEHAGLLGLAASVALLDALSGRTQVPLQVKWPNDVYVAGRGKVAGFLVEVVSQRQTGFDIVLGMGLNRLRQALPPEGAALEEVMMALPDQAQLVAWFLTHWLEWLERLACASGREALCARWQSSALWLDEWVEVTQPDQRRRGVMTGIDPQGRLLLQTPDGEMIFSAGDVRLRGGSVADNEG